MPEKKRYYKSEYSYSTRKDNKKELMFLDITDEGDECKRGDEAKESEEDESNEKVDKPSKEIQRTLPGKRSRLIRHSYRLA